MLDVTLTSGGSFLLPSDSARACDGFGRVSAYAVEASCGMKMVAEGVRISLASHEDEEDEDEAAECWSHCSDASTARACVNAVAPAASRC